MTGWFRRIMAIAAKEFIHLRRDRLTSGMILGIPVVMTLLFGYAINNDVRDLRAAVADDAGTTAARALVAATQASGVLQVVAQADGPRELEHMLARGDVSVGIYLPPDFEHRLATGTEPLAQILADGSDPVVLSAVRGLVSHAGRALISNDHAGGGLPVQRQDAAMASATDRSAPILALRALYNPERRSAVFIVPGLVGVILTLTMVLFTAVAIVRERERGNLELLINTPVRSVELMLGKIMPYILIGYVQASVILGIGVSLFQVPVRGELTDFNLGAGLFVISILALGLLISTIARNQFQAFQLTFISFLPQLLLSGFMFPFEGMPRPAQWLAEMFPLTHFLRIVRGVVLRDADLVLMRADIWPLALFGVIVMSLAILRFRKRLD